MKKLLNGMAKAYCIKTNRSLLSISGKDSASVLQGITTNNILSFQKDIKRTALYCGFLNNQGRMVSDAIVIKPQVSEDCQWKIKENEYWLDIPQELTTDVETYIKKYLFRKKASLDNISKDMQINAIYSQLVKGDCNEGEMVSLQDQEEAPDEDGLYRSLCFADPRTKLLGIRLVSSKEAQPHFNAEVEPGSKEEYKVFRLLQSVLEGNELVGKIPFVVNLDILGGISFNKGCYVGQELTARSYHTGVVRRRCLPFIVGDTVEWNSSFDVDLMNAEMINKESQPLGKIVAQQNNFIVASVNYIDQDFKEATIKNLNAKLVLSNQLLDKLNAYKQQINDRL